MLRPTGGMVGWDCYALPAAEGWECYALPAAGWDGIASPYRRGGMEMLRITGGRVAAEGWECFDLPAAGWDGIATS